VNDLVLTIFRVSSLSLILFSIGIGLYIDKILWFHLTIQFFRPSTVVAEKAILIAWHDTNKHLKKNLQVNEASN
jgi:hypothetical protein